jgi:hypothetical protein
VTAGCTTQYCQPGGTFQISPNACLSREELIFGANLGNLLKWAEGPQISDRSYRAIENH